MAGARSIRQERRRVVAGAALADLGRIRARGADARIRLALAIVRVAVLARGAIAERARVIDARAARVVAHLAERTRRLARILLARAEATALTGRTVDVRTARDAVAADAILGIGAGHTGARVRDAHASDAVLGRGAAIGIGGAIVRQALTARRVALERVRTGRDAAQIDARRGVVAVVLARLLHARDIGARDAVARIVDAELIGAALLAERARELARAARERALAVHALGTVAAQRAFVGLAIAVVILAVARLGIDRLARATGRHAVDAHRLLAGGAVAAPAAVRAGAGRARIADPVLVEVTVAIVVDVIARVIGAGGDRVARDHAVHAHRLADAAVARACRRREVFIDPVIAIVVEAVAGIAVHVRIVRGVAALNLLDARAERVRARARLRAVLLARMADVLRDRAVRGIARVIARGTVRRVDRRAADREAVADAIAIVILAVADTAVGAGARARGRRGARTVDAVRGIEHAIAIRIAADLDADAGTGAAALHERFAIAGAAAAIAAGLARGARVIRAGAREVGVAIAVLVEAVAGLRRGRARAARDAFVDLAIAVVVEAVAHLGHRTLDEERVADARAALAADRCARAVRHGAGGAIGLARARARACVAGHARAIDAANVRAVDQAHALLVVRASGVLGREVFVDLDVAIVVAVVAGLRADRFRDDVADRQLEAGLVGGVVALVDERQVRRATRVRDRFDRGIARRHAEADDLGLDLVVVEHRCVGSGARRARRIGARLRIREVRRIDRRAGRERAVERCIGDAGDDHVLRRLDRVCGGGGDGDDAAGPHDRADRDRIVLRRVAAVGRAVRAGLVVGEPRRGRHRRDRERAVERGVLRAVDHDRIANRERVDGLRVDRDDVRRAGDRIRPGRGAGLAGRRLPRAVRIDHARHRRRRGARTAQQVDRVKVGVAQHLGRCARRIAATGLLPIGEEHGDVRPALRGAAVRAAVRRACRARVAAHAAEEHAVRRIVEHRVIAGARGRPDRRQIGRLHALVVALRTEQRTAERRVARVVPDLRIGAGAIAGVALEVHPCGRGGVVAVDERAQQLELVIVRIAGHGGRGAAVRERPRDGAAERGTVATEREHDVAVAVRDAVDRALRVEELVIELRDARLATGAVGVRAAQRVRRGRAVRTAARRTRARRIVHRSRGIEDQRDVRFQRRSAVTPGDRTDE